MLIQDPEVYKPVSVMLVAFLASFSLEVIESLNGYLLVFGRMLTGIAMIFGAGLTIYSTLKKYRNEQNERRKN
jgi:hypothetical protein